MTHLKCLFCVDVGSVYNFEKLQLESDSTRNADYFDGLYDPFELYFNCKFPNGEDALSNNRGIPTIKRASEPDYQ